MAYLLNVVYLALLVGLSPWFAYQALTRGKYRHGWGARLLGNVPRPAGGRPVVWLHAVSVGEVNLLATLLKEFDRRGLEVECAISTTTAAGYALAKTKYAPRTVFYCPLDFSWAVRRALARLRPELLILAELELWPNLIRYARASGARVAVVNGRLSEQSFRGYLRVRRLLAPTLARIDLIAAQNAEYAARFRQLGARPEAVHVTGSLKYDGAATDRKNPKTERLAELAGIRATDVVFLAGSTQDPEESLALDSYLALAPEYPELRLLLVPRHPERFGEVAQLLKRRNLEFQRRSELEATGPNPATRVLLVDTVGELGAWWGTARIAFVGGSLSTRGGQNMIEPAAYGAAVSFGPSTRNFRDIVAALLGAEGAQVVQNGE
ncbi:MAG: 3-deoxy-D-manno-octulosonic acid transferase, partial [Planctomycetaceae bacterium]|nr:3-deoxy-D-manno-octulosonic acid transferase [Planctomycetaceae bacterium]